VKPREVYRTGQLAHVKRDVFAKLFSVPITDQQACVFVEPGVIVRFQAMMLPTLE